MAEAANDGTPFDPRLYLALILLRWQIVTVCFLYGLLVGVLFLQFTPKKFVTQTELKSFIDPSLENAVGTRWASVDRHRSLLGSNQARDEAVERLSPEWGAKLGDKRKMFLDIEMKTVGQQRLRLTIHSENPRYAEALLRETLKIHQRMFDESRAQGTESATDLITKELAKMEELIHTADNAVFEYERLNDIRRVSTQAKEEDQYITNIMSQRRALRTKMWMMEMQFPALRTADLGVIESVNAYRLTGEGKLVLNIAGGAGAAGGNEGEASPSSATGAAGEDIPSVGKTGAESGLNRTMAERGIGWADLRYSLIELETKEAEMAKSLKDDHPLLKDTRKQIADVRNRLRMAAEMEFRSTMDDYRATQLTHDALEAAEYKWQAVNWEKARKMAELRRLQSQRERYEKSYADLYQRLNDIRITEEIRAERVEYGTPSSSSTPVWPDPIRVLGLSLGIGLGVGIGLSVLMQVFDNKVQTIADVERKLGIPFLGGVPYWVHSGLEKAIRPIVTEEHSVGAVEAYRALRTNIMAALEKAGEKVLIVTSADSREGKTLTALNTAIMMAQMHRRVLLVDMDLRRGRLHRSLGLDKEPGITNVLRGEMSLRSVIVPTRIENLFLAPPGPAAEDAPELLQSVGPGNVFTEILDEYDYIVCDTSPVLRVTDTVILASHGVGVVVYVARVNHTPKPLIRYSLDVLKDARVVGMVLNSIEMHKIASMYYAYQYPNYAYYSNAYSYGYSYAYYGDQADIEGKKIRRRGGVTSGSKRSLGKWFTDTFLPSA